MSQDPLTALADEDTESPDPTPSVADKLPPIKPGTTASSQISGSSRMILLSAKGILAPPHKMHKRKRKRDPIDHRNLRLDGFELPMPCNQLAVLAYQLAVLVFGGSL